jgi:hypothetical protein
MRFVRAEIRSDPFYLEESSKQSNSSCASDCCGSRTLCGPFIGCDLGWPTRTSRAWFVARGGDGNAGNQSRHIGCGRCRTSDSLSHGVVYYALDCAISCSRHLGRDSGNYCHWCATYRCNWNNHCGFGRWRLVR